MVGRASRCVLYAGCLAIYLVTPDAVFRDPGSVRLWVFVVLLMIGVVAGNLRTIAMPTLVTLLIPEDRRDKANGLVGTATGVSFLVTSVISGLLVAAGGMLYVLLLAIAVLALADGAPRHGPGPGDPAGRGWSAARRARASTCAAPSGWSAAYPGWSR